MWLIFYLQKNVTLTAVLHQNTTLRLAAPPSMMERPVVLQDLIAVSIKRVKSYIRELSQNLAEDA